jgi:hypothetical protein
MNTKLAIFVLMIFLTNFSFADPFDAFKEIAKELDKSINKKEETKKEETQKQPNSKKNEENSQVSTNGNMFELFTRKNKTQSVRWENLGNCNSQSPQSSTKPGIRFFDKNNQFPDLDEKGYAFQYYTGNSANPKYYGNIKTITQDPQTKLITTEEIIKFDALTNFRGQDMPGSIYISKNIYKIDDYKMQIMYMDMTSDDGKKVFVENGIDKSTKKEDIKYDCDAPESIALLGNIEKNKKIAEDKSKNSPEGKAASLVDFYSSFLIVQDCYEIRKPYAVQYINPELFSTVKKNIKIIETNIKKTTPSLDTDKLWIKAASDYKNSSYGQSIALHKNAPQNYLKDVQTACNLSAFSINESVPKEIPKKNF